MQQKVNEVCGPPARTKQPVSRRRRKNPKFSRLCNRLAAIADLQFLIDVAGVPFDRDGRDVESGGDLLVPISLSQQRQYLKFAVC